MCVGSILLSVRLLFFFVRVVRCTGKKNDVRLSELGTYNSTAVACYVDCFLEGNGRDFHSVLLYVDCLRGGERWRYHRSITSRHKKVWGGDCCIVSKQSCTCKPMVIFIRKACNGGGTTAAAVLPPWSRITVFVVSGSVRQFRGKKRRCDASVLLLSLVSFSFSCGMDGWYISTKYTSFYLWLYFYRCFGIFFARPSVVPSLARQASFRFVSRYFVFVFCCFI